jgi:hypothetical protein
VNRPRRKRRTAALRQLVREHELSPADLIQPIFVVHGSRIEREVSSMPGVFHLSVDEKLDREVDWVIKYKLIEAFRERHQLTLGDPRVQLLDLQYHDVSRHRSPLRSTVKVMGSIASRAEVMRALLFEVWRCQAGCMPERSRMRFA